MTNSGRLSACRSSRTLPGVDAVELVEQILLEHSDAFEPMGGTLIEPTDPTRPAEPEDVRMALVTAAEILQASMWTLPADYLPDAASLREERNAFDNTARQQAAAAASDADTLSKYASAIIGLVSGTIIQSVGALFFMQSNRARRQLAEFFDRLRRDRRFDEALRLVRDVSNPDKRADLQRDIALALIKPS